MYQVGIDIGSSSAKTAVLKGGEIIKTILLDTGFSSRKVADEIYAMLEAEGITRENAGYVATGYGRVSVPYADDTVTEITCHGKGSYFLFRENGTVIDIVTDHIIGENYVTVSHANGVTSTYKYIEAKEGLKKGDSVKRGDVLGKIAPAAGVEMKQGDHLHFEMSVNGKPADPDVYLDISEK